VQKQLVKSRTLAQKLIVAGRVSIEVAGAWHRINKPATKVHEDIALRVDYDHEQKYVSRAGLKLEGALHEIGYSPAGKIALDVGQSTGGFTDCLLQHGAAKVIGVDVGHGQLDDTLRHDPRVICCEGLNARHLEHGQLTGLAENVLFDVIVMDVSFISQTLVLPCLVPLMSAGGTLISLVKPQFEVGPGGTGKGGLVRDASLYPVVERKLCQLAGSLGFSLHAFFESPILGGSGNREFFLCVTKN